MTTGRLRKRNRYSACYTKFICIVESLIIIANIFFVHFVRVICPEMAQFHGCLSFSDYSKPNYLTGTPVAGSRVNTDRSFEFHFFIVQHCVKVACRRKQLKITKRLLQITIQQWCLTKIFIFISLESTKMFLHQLVGTRRFLSARLAVNSSNCLVHEIP